MSLGEFGSYSSPEIDEISDLRSKIEWLKHGLEHIRDGKHLCSASNLAKQVLDGHVWDAEWAG